MSLGSSSQKGQSASTVDPSVIKKLDDGYRRLRSTSKSECNSLLKKHLRPSLFDKLKKLQTSYGSTLLDVIQAGLDHFDSKIGICAPDPEAYNVFYELFDPIIEESHDGFKRSQRHPTRDLGDIRQFQNLDTTKTYVKSIRLRTSRNLEGYPLHPSLTQAQYVEIESKIHAALLALPQEYKGSYHTLGGLAKETQTELEKQHFLFHEGDRFMRSASAHRHWPTGRAVFYNNDKTFLVWVNEEDHFRMISMQTGGDLGAVYRRFVTALKAVEKKLTFSHCEFLGYLTFYPINLGTTIRVSVYIKVPCLATNKDHLESILEKYDLECHASRNEEDGPGHFVVSNKRRLGVTEFDTIKAMQNGIMEIIEVEKSMKGSRVPTKSV